MAKLFALALIGIVLLQSAPAAADDTQKRTDIVKLLSASGTDGFVTSMIPQMVKQGVSVFSRMVPGMPPEHLRIVEEEMIAEFRDSRDEFYNAMVPIYMTAFTHDEIRALLDFWQSPVGQKMRSKIPEISRAGVLLGQQWGRQVGSRAVERIKVRLRKLGYKI
ncbi:MAG: DUF2059 domain-containing protein [Alphaproteobacteria bacterium]|nr:DUF2059 domain-containing protein [Alphaproteobacteria bacterium]